MEVRSQDKVKGMPTSLNCSLPNRDSSSKIPCASIISALEGERISDHQITATQTNEHHQPLYHHPPRKHHQTLKAIRDPDLISDQDLAPARTPISPTSELNPTTTRLDPSSRSMPRSPPPEQTPTPITTASAASAAVRYRECLKNHAAGIGGHVVDGCGEFMPSGDEGTLEAMKCAACECHRNFHRKEISGESHCVTNFHYKTNNQRNNNTNNNTVPSPLHLPIHHRPRYPLGFSPAAPNAPQVMMSFGGGGGGGGAAESSSEDLNMFQSILHGEGSMQRLKKRCRTKFSQEQKDKMMEFAERLGWKIQNQDEEQVQQFCSHVGVQRKVFKVWMHNNKQAMKKKQT